MVVTESQGTREICAQFTAQVRDAGTLTFVPGPFTASKVDVMHILVVCLPFAVFILSCHPLNCGNFMLLLSVSMESVFFFLLSAVEDFNATTVVLGFPRNNIIDVCFDLAITQDNAFEENELFRVNLMSDSTDICPEDNSALIHIIDSTRKQSLQGLLKVATRNSSHVPFQLVFAWPH